MEKFALFFFLKIIGVQNQLHISFGTSQSVKDTKVFKSYPYTVEFTTFYILLHIKSESKVI